MKPRTRSRRLVRQCFWLLGIGVVMYCFLFLTHTPPRMPNLPVTRVSKLPAAHSSLSLTEKQCRRTFPGLFQSIDDVVAQGPFKLSNKGERGPLQGRIQDGKIYILNALRDKDQSKEMLNSRLAALQQLHRAILTSPEPIPDTYFAINYQDSPYGTAWAYSRPAYTNPGSVKPNDRSFLMPHFSFWAWPLPFIGSIDRAATAIETIEALLPFSAKDPRAIWRGTHWFNSIANPYLRQDLLKTTKNKTWADVQAFERRDENDKDAGFANAIPIEGFCKYKYVLHTEGVAYSGRFQFLQMCASVTITPPIQWMQHTTHLVKPVFASDMMGVQRGKVREAVMKAWPTTYKAEEANIVFVKPDWSDLEATIEWLEKHPSIAEGIARRQRELFVGGGYFSPAAEACYWRSLLRGWSKVVEYDESDWKDDTGMTFEKFTLTGVK